MLRPTPVRAPVPVPELVVAARNRRLAATGSATTAATAPAAAAAGVAGPDPGDYAVRDRRAGGAFPHPTPARTSLDRIPAADAPPGSAARRRSDTTLRVARRACGAVGAAALAQLGKVAQLAAIASTVVANAARPASWGRTVRPLLARNVISSGVEAVAVVCVLGVALGILLVVQYQLWVGQLVQARWLASVWVTVVVRELGPLLVNLVVIARTGSSMAAELALVHGSGEDRVVEGQGLDPLAYLVYPRVAGLVLSTWGLTLVFVEASFVSVYVGGQWMGTKTGTFWNFTQDTLGALGPADVATLLLKSTLPALLAGCICCAEGLGAGHTRDDVTRASRIAVQRSVMALFIVSALVSVVAYI